MRRRPDDPDRPADGFGEGTSVMPGDPDEPGGEGRDRRVYYASETATRRPTPNVGRGGYEEARRPDREPAPSVGRGGGGPPRSSSRDNAQRPRRGRPRIGRILAVLVVLLLVGTGVLYVVFDGKLQRVDALPDYEGRPAGGKGTNWLIVGSDSREGLSEKERDKLGTGFAAGRRTDTVMIMHISGTVPTLVSLPRDSYVPIPGHSRNKLNAAFAFGGPKLLARTVEQATGLRMDHYMEIGFGGFAGLVDAVGGVTMCIEKPVKDRDSGLNIKKAGCQLLDSKQALAYVRARHAFAQGDLARAQHQREFIGALIKKATSPAIFLNPFKSIPLANEGTKALRVNSGDHLYHLVRLAFAMKALNGSKGTSMVVPVKGTGSAGSAGSVVFWDQQKASALFDALNNGRSVKEFADTKT
jgi:LCP family protein required for cell wall assembly